MNLFQQLLYIAPEFYSYQWIKKPRAYQQYTLSIDFAGNVPAQLSQGQLDERQSIFKNRLLELTKSHHDKFLEDLQQKPKSVFDIEVRAETFKDPFLTQMWHYKFDPHSVPVVPSAPIDPLPTSTGHRRVETVKDFLDKSNIMRYHKSLVIQALNKTAFEEAKQSASPGDEHRSLHHDKAMKDKAKLEAWSKKTGLSIETLKLIQTKQQVIKENKEKLDQTVLQPETQKKKLQQLNKLSDMIKSTFSMKMKQVMDLRELVKCLNDNQRGIFQSQSKIETVLIFEFQTKFKIR